MYSLEGVVSSAIRRTKLVSEVVVTLSINEARAILVALGSATSEEDEDVFEFAERLDAAVRVEEAS